MTLKRTAPMKRTRMKRGKAGLRRTRIRSVGARAERDRDATQAFRAETLASVWCERCLPRQVEANDPHHLCLRTRGMGHQWLHDAERNGAPLCRKCHIEVHANSHDSADWIKTRAWLDAGGKLNTKECA